ncbi:antibiotic biosynthesis monooxygenase family protein [Chitinophaga sp. RAB17]|uniref:antibiotic biosynthesis monooxygenase family protein n=1 Tax=Chitinophaga sp. RAB17 TaxID=3233049 RepID=UPI003F91A66E
MSANKNYTVEIIRYNIRENDQQNFETAYVAAGKLLQASPYCLAYEVIHGIEEPHHYIVTIHWTSKEDHLNGFRKEAEFPPFFELVKPFYNSIEEMKHYEVTSNQWQRS